MKAKQNQNTPRTITGAIAAIAGILVGFTCLVTICGLSICGLDVTKGMVATYLAILVPIAVVFGYCKPHVWWISPVFLGPALIVTAIELVMAYELERFAATSILAAGMIFGGFVGACIAKVTDRANEKTP